MKILYAIQGTGNGHLARAEDIVPILRKHGELDLLVSGAQADIRLSYPVKYKSKGLSFYFGKSGGVDLVKTFRKNSSKNVFREIRDFPVGKYDVIINDFEPISAWACYRKEKSCIALSHQSALLSPKVPRPKHHDPVGEWILKNYAPATAHVGFHFSQFDKNIFTPVIRESVRKAAVETKDHYTVYLPAYDDKKLVPLLLNFKGVKWHVFSKHAKKSYHVEKLSVYPVNNADFQVSMATSTGVLCGAGFETPAEALYLKKKLMVVPMKNQYEQYFNAAALKSIGVPVLKNVKKKRLDKIGEWIDDDKKVEVEYPNIAEGAVARALSFV
ncbi:MAG TPA: glycosyltransferase family protein [Chryseosolibacter sp.]|nr:glycosyltransferase family protein [Chryseosolibacter sp.]